MDETSPPAKPGDHFLRAMPSLFKFVDRLVQEGNADGAATVSEATEAEMMREIRWMGAVIGGVGALVAAKHWPEGGPEIFARICADHIASDPRLREILRGQLNNTDKFTRPVLAELLELAGDSAG